MNDLQNNDLIGKLVLSKAGRDRNHLYVVIAKFSKRMNMFFFLMDLQKMLINQKKKKVKHLTFYDIINDESQRSYH